MYLMNYLLLKLSSPPLLFKGIGRKKWLEKEKDKNQITTKLQTLITTFTLSE